MQCILVLLYFNILYILDNTNILIYSTLMHYTLCTIFLYCICTIYILCMYFSMYIPHRNCHLGMAQGLGILVTATGRSEEHTSRRGRSTRDTSTGTVGTAGAPARIPMGAGTSACGIVECIRYVCMYASSADVVHIIVLLYVYTVVNMYSVYVAYYYVV